MIYLIGIPFSIVMASSCDINYIYRYTQQSMRIMFKKGRHVPIETCGVAIVDKKKKIEEKEIDEIDVSDSHLLLLFSSHPSAAAPTPSTDIHKSTSKSKINVNVNANVNVNTNNSAFYLNRLPFFAIGNILCSWLLNNKNKNMGDQNRDKKMNKDKDKDNNKNISISYMSSIFLIHVLLGYLILGVRSLCMLCAVVSGILSLLGGIDIIRSYYKLLDTM